MYKFVTFVIVIGNLCNRENCLNVTNEGVCTDLYGNKICCFNYELSNETCLACLPGFIRPNGSSCVPCNDGWYGHQCLQQCKCHFYERCENVVGCVNKSITIGLIQTTITETTLSTVREDSTTYMSSFRNDMSSFSSEDIRIQKSTPEAKSGLLQREIVIYSLVTGGVLVTLGLTSLVRKYRKKIQGKATKPGTPNTNQSNSRRQTRSRVDSASSLYAEIDETMLVENADMRTWQTKHIGNANAELGNNDNTSYLCPVHSEGDSSSFRGTGKSFNRSYLSLYESDQNQNSDEFDKDDDATSYLHPYNTIDEDWKEKTHQYDVPHAPHKDTDDSSVSSTKMINDVYLHPYQPLNEDWKQTSHSYEVPVTIHKCPWSSLSSLLKSKKDLKGEDNCMIENDLHNRVNVLPLKNDNSQNSTLEEKSFHKIKPKTTITDISFKLEKNDAVVVSYHPVAVTSNAEMNKISAGFDNNIEKSQKFEDINKGAMNDCCNTQKSNELDLVVKSDVQCLANSENNLCNFNSLNVFANNENDCFLSEAITNVHDYTDAKSQ